MTTAFILIKTSQAEEGKVRLEAQVFGSRAARDSEFRAVVSANEMLPPHPLGRFFEPVGFVQVSCMVTDSGGIDEVVAEAAAQWLSDLPGTNEERIGRNANWGSAATAADGCPALTQGTENGCSTAAGLSG